MDNHILASTIQEFCRDGTPCRIVVPFIAKTRNSIFTGIILGCDDKFILFQDKYMAQVVINISTIIRMEKLDGGIENG
jgi:hypothetical protein